MPSLCQPFFECSFFPRFVGVASRFALPDSRSVSTVLRRAMSFRMVRNRNGFSSGSVALRNRSRNRSSSSSVTRDLMSSAVISRISSALIVCSLLRRGRAGTVLQVLAHDELRPDRHFGGGEGHGLF